MKRKNLSVIFMIKVDIYRFAESLLIIASLFSIGEIILSCNESQKLTLRRVKY